MKETIRVTERTDQHELVRLSNPEFRLQTPEQGVRGLDMLANLRRA
jgi:hypothetical protein